MEDDSLIFGIAVGFVAGATLMFLILGGLALNHNSQSSQENQIKELKQKIEIIELNKKLLELKEVK